MNREETSRSCKPSLALYRPPNARSKHLSRTSTTQHIHPSVSSSSLAIKSPTKQMPIKGVLKRSKSFGSAGSTIPRTVNLNEFNLSPGQVALIKRALNNPCSLSMTQLMEIVSAICAKAMESSMNAYGLAKICIEIEEKDTNQLFMEALINCCQEWFNERDKLTKTSGHSGQHQQQHPKQKWWAYISFVTELYLNLKSKHREVKLMLAIQSDPKGSLTSFPEENSDDEELRTKKVNDRESYQDHEPESDSSDDFFNLSLRQSRCLAMLLYDCCQTILSSLGNSNSTTIDIECLLNVLRSAGRYIEQENVQRMDKIINLTREVYVGPVAAKLSAMSLKSILELIEYRSSGWQFDQAQQIYYFPYTRPS